MSRRINQLISFVVIIWILVFIFQKEILSFVGSWGPSAIKDISVQALNFMIFWAGKAWDIVKAVLIWLVDEILKIVSNLSPFNQLGQSLGTTLSNIIKAVLNFLSPLLGKIFQK